MSRAAVVLVGAVGCGGAETKSADPDSGVGAAPDLLEAWCPGDAAAATAWAAEVRAAMTLEEKVAQMAGVSTLTDEAGRYSSGEDLRHGVPAFHMMDGPRGAHHASGPATAFPVGIARGATWSPELEAQVGAAIGREVRAVGVNVLLAPTINVLRHPRWGRSQETYGEDPHHLGALGRAFVEGAQTEVLAQPKHYAVNSIENTRFDVDVQIDPAALHEVYLPHFREVLVAGGAATVMAAYNHVNGPPAAESSPLLTDILRDQWGFPGVVVSDWIFATETTEGAALAGLDIEMPSPRVYGEALVAAVAEGRVPERFVDDAVERILRTKACFGLELQGPVPDADLRLTDAHLDLAREVAERAAVLLHNTGGVPLEDGLRVAVTGRLADVENIGDRGSSSVTAPDVITVWEGLRDEAGGREVALVDRDDTAAMAAADAVVVVVGLTDEDEGEGLIAAGDRTGLALREVDVDTIRAAAAASDRVVVVLEGGGAITVEGWLDDTEAVLMGWYPGAMGGTALARLVYGDVVPAGRLPLTVPVAEADLPPFDNVSLTVTYDAFHGYRHLDRTGTPARFPFGFGLSTTTFTLGPARLDPVAAGLEVRLTVTNTGDRPGYETVQVYAGPVSVDPHRAPRELVAFSQVYLEPGAATEVVLGVDPTDLALFEEGRWVAAEGPHLLEVATSAEAVHEVLSVDL